jgi:type II secretory pathway pseudopilin PulG
MVARRRSLLLRGVLVLLLLALAGAEWLLRDRRARYQAETTRLRAGMTALERARADALLAAEQDRGALALALIRRQAAGDVALHLAVSADSGYVALERGAVRLRRFPAEMAADPAPEAAGRPVAAPRGLRHVERLVAAGDPAPDVPWWPGESPQPRWPTPLAVVASGGVLIYARPDSGALAQPGRVLPGAVRVAAHDLAAIRASITPGMPVYFF